MIQNQEHNTNASDSIVSQSVVNRLDSIPVPTKQDTIEAQSLGVDPIFILNERRSKEIREYRENQEKAKKQKVYKAILKKDTTCIVCPKGEQVSFQELLSTSQTTSPLFLTDNIWLYKKTLYTQGSKSNQLVFIEKQNTDRSNINLINKRNDAGSFGAPGWVFIILMLLFVVVTTTRVFFGKYLNALFQGAFSFYSASKIHREASATGKKVNFLLDLNFLIITSIFAVYALSFFDITIPLNIGNRTLSLLILGILLAFIIAKKILFLLVSSLSETKQEIHELLFNQRIYTRVLGFIMVPLNFVFLYSTEPVSTVALYVTLTTIAIVLIMSTLRTFQLFISKGFSIFYFLLYLCALEITPIIVLLKEVIAL